jgi:hypothetical protein
MAVSCGDGVGSNRLSQDAVDIAGIVQHVAELRVIHIQVERRKMTNMGSLVHIREAPSDHGQLQALPDLAFGIQFAGMQAG